LCDLIYVYMNSICILIVFNMQFDVQLNVHTCLVCSPWHLWAKGESQAEF